MYEQLFFVNDKVYSDRDMCRIFD